MASCDQNSMLPGICMLLHAIREGRCIASINLHGFSHETSFPSLFSTFNLFIPLRTRACFSTQSSCAFDSLVSVISFPQFARFCVRARMRGATNATLSPRTAQQHLILLLPRIDSIRFREQFSCILHITDLFERFPSSSPSFQTL